MQRPLRCTVRGDSLVCSPITNLQLTTHHFRLPSFAPPKTKSYIFPAAGLLLAGLTRGSPKGLSRRKAAFELGRDAQLAWVLLARVMRKAADPVLSDRAVAEWVFAVEGFVLDTFCAIPLFGLFLSVVRAVTPEAGHVKSDVLRFEAGQAVKSPLRLADGWIVRSCVSGRAYRPPNERPNVVSLVSWWRRKERAFFAFISPAVCCSDWSSGANESVSPVVRGPPRLALLFCKSGRPATLAGGPKRLDKENRK